MVTELATLSKEVSVKTLPDGNKILKNRIAINQGKDITTFINITAWGELAEFMGKTFQKGDEVFITGVLKNMTIKVDNKDVTINYVCVKSAIPTFGTKSKFISSGGMSDNQSTYLTADTD